MNTRREGFALIMALLTIVVLTGGVVTAFNMVVSERRVVANQDARIDAFLLAETGRERFLLERTALGFTSEPPDALEVDTLALDGGYAIVTLQLLRAATATTQALYLLRSRGVVTQGSWAGAPAAERTVAQYVVWQTASLDADAALTSLSGLNFNGSSGNIRGNDECLAEGPLPGVSVPASPGYSYSGSGTGPTIDPGVAVLAPTPAEMADEVDVDWDYLLEEFSYDLYLAGGTASGGAGWPDFSDPDYWPTIYVDGDFTLMPAGSGSVSGRGLLVVKGNLTLSGRAIWEGVILVGGTMTGDGRQTLEGAAITGLDVKRGMPVSDEALGNGTKTIQYNSCHVESALSAIKGLRPYGNAWVDNWATW